MEENYNLSLLVPFSPSINTINGIKFSSREIDILACILGGRTTKKIASFLSLSPKTVENYIRNITLKIDCNSREGIIDFVEQSDKLFLTKDHYSNLLLQAEFEKSLKEIFKLNGEKTFRCLLLYGEEYAFHSSFIPCLQRHLGLAGLTVTIEAQRGLTLFSEGILEFRTEEEPVSQTDSSSKKSFFFLHEKDDAKDGLEEFTKYGNIEIIKEKNYYFLVLHVLQKLLFQLNLGRIVSEFKEKHETFHKRSYSHISSQGPQQDHTVHHPIKNFIQKRKWPLASALVVGGIVGMGFFTIGGRQDGHHNPSHIQVNQVASPIRSDLILPTKTVYLDRPQLITQIEEKLKAQGDIQTIALVGVGGAGKTTLAREYARSQKAPLIWEINAETHVSLISSFEKMAERLAQTEEEKKVFQSIQNLKDTEKKEEKLFLFVKEKLKTLSGWFLIYDNVEKFADIQNYFPLDSGTWGQGKVILTTRDNNIQNNKHVNYVIPVEALNTQQKLDLFTKIMYNGKVKSVTLAQREEDRKFLEALPPFPLDISIAAYYLKATQIPYGKYLNSLHKDDEDFINLQKNILKDSGEYVKTRYHIITLSLQHFINCHKDFGDLLLFISLLDSQNIPREVLDKYKKGTIVDNFIYHLKKYSLITNQSASSPLGITFSIHRSTQEISLNYLIKTLNLAENNQLLQSIANNLRDYVEKITEQRNYHGAEFLISHCKRFFTHNLLTSETRGTVGCALGNIYTYLHYFAKAKEVLEPILANLKEDEHKNRTQIARILGYLGFIYREQGAYEKAKNLLEQSIVIYKKNLPEDNISLAETSIHLGNVYNALGNYEKAKDLLEQNFIIYKKHLPENHVEIAWASGYLGFTYSRLGNYKKAKDLFEKSVVIYKNLSIEGRSIGWALGNLGNVYVKLGNYEKAKDLLERSFAIYKKHLPEDDTELARASVNLGKIYAALNNYEKAKNLFQRGLIIYRKYLSENHLLITDALVSLGNAYKNLGHYAKAKTLLEQSLRVYENHFGKEHIETARVLKDLGEICLLEDDLGKAEGFLYTSLKIFQKSNHPDIYMVLESLAQFSLKKSKNEESKGNYQPEAFKTKAIDFLKQALDVANANFPEESQHIVKIKNKLENINEK